MRSSGYTFVGGFLFKAECVDSILQYLPPYIAKNMTKFIVSKDLETCFVFLTYSIVYRNIPAWFNCHGYVCAYTISTSIMPMRMWDTCTCMCGKFRTGIHPLTSFYFYGWLSILSIRMENPSKSWHFEFGWISIVDLTVHWIWSTHYGYKKKRNKLNKTFGRINVKTSKKDSKRNLKEVFVNKR